MKNKIFEVDVLGLRSLQESKPKWFIIRELLQNAMDEEISECTITTNYEYGKAHIKVEDDSPVGFRDLTDIYTLFKDTYKRSNVKKRGRYNLGEKQILCLADHATILSTKGGIEFQMLKGIRTMLRKKREKGSEVYVVVRMNKDEYIECRDYCFDVLVPQNIKVIVKADKNDEYELPYRKPHKIFNVKLPTEIKVGDVMKIVTRETEVQLNKSLPTKYIYEMGIPICEIDCEYSIDVQQKVPMSNDRDKIDSKYLKMVFGEVLNHTIHEITPEQSSSLWVRNGFTSDRTESETRKKIITKRFGEKALIANPMDKRSMDEAISRNYNVIYGSEMDKEEWNAVREDELLVSTSAMFKVGVADGKMVEPTKEQLMIATFCIKAAIEFLGLKISVKFYDSVGATVRADYNSGENLLRFNVAKFNDADWETDSDKTIKQEMLDLVIHELGHSRGWHYESSYHECITELGSKMTKKAINDPKFFKLY